MKVKLLSITNDAECLIELAGRTAYQSQDMITTESAEKFVRMLIKHGHESVLEHATATFRISGVSRAMTHQLVRHRLVSYTQRSQRYVDENSFNVIVPDSVKETRMVGGSYHVQKQFETAIASAKFSYKRLIKWGVPKEDARFVLPNACETEIVVTANFRQWRHMIKLRTSKHAQWEISAVFKDILEILEAHCPSVFSDLG